MIFSLSFCVFFIPCFVRNEHGSAKEAAKVTYIARKQWGQVKQHQRLGTVGVKEVVSLSYNPLKKHKISFFSTRFIILTNIF